MRNIPKKRTHLFYASKSKRALLLSLCLSLTSMARAQQCDSETGCTVFPLCETSCGDTSSSSSDGNPNSTNQVTATGPFSTGPHWSPSELLRAAKQTIAAGEGFSLKDIIDGLTLQPTPGLSTYTNLTDPHDGNVLKTIPNPGTFPTRQAGATNQTFASVPNSEPVAGDGEFTLDETDISFPGVGIPFVFSRHYRSGIDFQSSLGFGWSFSYNEILSFDDSGLISNPNQAHYVPPDVHLTNDRMERLSFSFSGLSAAGDRDLYKLIGPGHMTLSRAHKSPGADWQLDDGSGLTRAYDGQFGGLKSVQDKAGHSIQIEWTQPTPVNVPFLGGTVPLIWADRQQRITKITDTTGRPYYFNYTIVPDSRPFTNATLVDNLVSSINSDNGYENLSCITLSSADTMCKKPLVSFTVTPVIAESHVYEVSDQDLAFYGNGNQQIAFTWLYARNMSFLLRRWEFDLTRVQDADSNGPSYEYYLNGTIDKPLTYSKQFDTYWPSQYGAQMLQFFQEQATSFKTQQCPQVAQRNYTLFCTGNSAYQTFCPGRMADEAGPSLRKAQENANGIIASATKACDADLDSYKSQLKKKVPKVFTYGVPPELYHNMTVVRDADNRIVVENTYGQDPTQPDFDRVGQQILGAVSSNSTNYKYIDLTRIPDDSKGSDSAAASVYICPSAGGSYLSAKRYLNDKTARQYQNPSLKIEISGPLGRNSSLYLDAAGRLLRTINPVGRPTDYNYDDAGPIGILATNGSRSCRQYDSNGLLTQQSDLPAEGAIGEVLTTSYVYDTAGQLTEETRKADAEVISHRRYLRDSVERIVEIGDDINATITRWTCLQYTDMIDPIALSSSVSTSLSENRLGPGREDSPQYVPVVRPCMSVGAAGVPVTLSGPTHYAALASQITLPDGSVIKLPNNIAAGPQEVIVDADGQTPIQRYFLYEDYGAIRETGLRHFGKQDQIPGSVLTWTHDLAGLTKSMSEPDESDPSRTVTTEFNYDKSRNRLQSARQPLITSHEVDAFGRNLVTREIPTGGAGASGDQRITCRRYNAYGELSEEISAGGVDTQFVYQGVTGQLTDITKGNVAAYSDNRYAPCTPQAAAANRSATREVVAHFEYNGLGQLVSSLRNGRLEIYSYDGFGRLIDTFVADQPAPGRSKYYSGIHFAKRFKADRKIWEGVFDAYPTGGVLPSYPVAGTHAVTEYSYDFVGRVTQQKRWNFTEGGVSVKGANPYVITAFLYDDSKNLTQITDENNTVSTETRDGAGRVIESYLAKGLAEQVHTTYSFGEGGAIRTSVVSPAPTSAGQISRTETYSPMGDLLQVDEQGRTLLKRSLDSFGRPQVDQTLSDLSTTYTFDAYNQPLSIQKQDSSATTFVPGSFKWNRDGQNVLAVDGAQHQTRRTYDPLGRLQSVQDGLGTTHYQYVPGTLLPATIVSAAAQIANTYDVAGRLKVTSVKDATGRDPAGTRSFSYSSLGFIATAGLSGKGVAPATVTATYDSLGRAVAESNDQLPYRIVRTYGPLTEYVELFGATSGTAAGSVERMTDHLGRPSSLKANGQTLAQWQYANGALSSINYSGGSVLHSGYDVLGHANATSVVNGGNAIASVTRSFGADDIPHQVTLTVNSTPVETAFFQTDESGRVITEQQVRPGVANLPSSLGNADVALYLTPSQSQYLLDGASNWQQRLGGAALSTTIDSANRYGSINGSGVTNISGGGISLFQNQKYRWDGLNQLTSATVGSNKRQWQYDALGRPTVESGGAQYPSQVIWDGDTPIGIVSGTVQSPNLTIQAGFTGQDTIAMVSASGGSTLLYHGPDESTFAATDQAGTLLQAYSYSAYGRPSVWSPGGLLTNSLPISRYLFQGAQYESSLSMYKMGARTYFPELGRFLSPDPIGQQDDLNLFSFVGGRPLSYADPTGTSGRPSEQTSNGNPNPAVSIGSLPNLSRPAFPAAATSGICWFCAPPPSALRWSTPLRAIDTLLQGADPEGSLIGFPILGAVRAEAAGDAAISQLGEAAEAGVIRLEQAGAVRFGETLDGWLSRSAGTISEAGTISGGSGANAALPMVTFDFLRTPELVENIAQAMKAGYASDGVLTYGGVGYNAFARPLALSEVRLQRAPLFSWDEFPFASTLEGGSSTWLGRVPAWQQSVQGGLLSGLYRGLSAGDRFRVNLINLPQN